MAKKGKFDRACSMCQTHYQYCSKCSDFDHLPRWMDAYCSERCKEIYNICAGFVNHWLDPEVEAARLANLELDDNYIKKLAPEYQNIIKEIQRIDTKNSVAIMQALTDSTEEKKVEDKKEEKVEKNKDESEKSTQTYHQKIQYKNSKPKNNQASK